MGNINEYQSSYYYIQGIYNNFFILWLLLHSSQKFWNPIQKPLIAVEKGVQVKQIDMYIYDKK